MTAISDNHSYTNLLNQIKDFKLVLNLLPFKTKELRSQLSEIEKQINDLRFKPDKFNQYYSELGWIAFESMNSDLIRSAVELAEDNKCDKGEQLLIEYYTTNDSIKYLLTRLKNRAGFRKRHGLLLKAFDDFKSERYHSCIPVFLMIIDGVVDEVTKSNNGFFASDFDARLWNSIVGHESGLSKIAKIYAKTRKKVNTDPITLPYRNGILHGKDINYDNVKVAAKCLATILAVGDWVEQYESGKHNTPEPSKPQSILQQLKELKDSISTFQKQQKETKIMNAEIENWQPRQISEEYIMHMNLQCDTCIRNSPEEKLIEFMTYFSNRNYGTMHDVIARQADKNKGQYIQTIKSYIGDFSLQDYQIVSITDCAPAISEIGVQLSIIDTSTKSVTLNTKCRMIYQKDAFNTSVLVRGNPQGQWFVVDLYLNEIYNKYWEAQ